MTKFEEWVQSQKIMTNTNPYYMAKLAWNAAIRCAAKDNENWDEVSEAVILSLIQPEEE